MSDETPIGPEETPASDAEPTPARTCEVCGAGLDADQTYCLECGSPTPLAPKPGRGMRGLAIIAGAVAALGLGAGALAYAVSSDDDPASVAVTASTTTTTLPGLPGAAPPPLTTGTLPPDTSFTSPTSPPTSTAFPTVTGPPATTPTFSPPSTTDLSAPVTPSTPDETDTSDTDTTTTTEPPDTSGDSDWPSGTTAWTVIVSSVRSETEARATKSRLTAAGTFVGVLFSSDHAGLKPGYWVVYSGRFSGQASAVTRAATLRPANPGAYARRIVG